MGHLTPGPDLCSDKGTFEQKNLKGVNTSMQVGTEEVGRCQHYWGTARVLCSWNGVLTIKGKTDKLNYANIKKFPSSEDVIW